MPHDRDQDLSELNEWVAAAGSALGIAPEEVPVGDILDLAKAVARGVLRPGVPVTGFLAGLAVGRGLPAEDVLATLSDRAQQWRVAPVSDEPHAAISGNGPSHRPGGTKLGR